MFPKPSRIKDLELLAEYQKMNCAACGTWWQVSGHHIRTRGAGGDDVPENLIPLCINCHTEIHKIGPTRFKAKWPHLKQYRGL